MTDNVILYIKMYYSFIIISASVCTGAFYSSAIYTLVGWYVFIYVYSSRNWKIKLQRRCFYVEQTSLWCHKCSKLLVTGSVSNLQSRFTFSRLYSELRDKFNVGWLHLLLIAITMPLNYNLPVSYTHLTLLETCWLPNKF